MSAWSIFCLVIAARTCAAAEEPADPPIDDSGYLRLKAEVPPLPITSRWGNSRQSRNFYADPEVLTVAGKYYLFTTSGDSSPHGQSGLGIRCFASSDLSYWKDCGLALDARNASYTQDMIWAPQAIRHDDGNFYLFYNACGPEYEKARKGWFAPNSPFQRLCVAKSRKPAGPYVEYAAPLLDGKSMPGYIDGKAGIIGCIDAYAFRDTDAVGKTHYYLYWSAIDDEHNQNLLWGAELTSNMRGLKLPPEGPEPRILIGQPMQEWEMKACGERRIAEAASVVRRGDLYYLLYAANSYNTPEYSMGYATSKSPMGPFTRANENPILHARADVADHLTDRKTWIGPAGGSFLKQADGTTKQIIFASIDEQTTIPTCENSVGHRRNIRIAPIEFTTSGKLQLRDR